MTAIVNPVTLINVAWGIVRGSLQFQAEGSTVNEVFLGRFTITLGDPLDDREMHIALTPEIGSPLIIRLMYQFSTSSDIFKRVEVTDAAGTLIGPTNWRYLISRVVRTGLG